MKSLKNPDDALCLSLFILSLSLSLWSPILFWGGDGNLIWLPVVQEFLRGNEFYFSSPRIFNGQNLMPLYGFNPVWILGRVFNFNPIQVLNLCYWVWVILAFFPIKIIISKFSNFKFSGVLAFTYVILSPVALNKLYAGHPMYLYALLPMSYFFALSLHEKKELIILGTLSIWLTTSQNSYPVLSYSLLYLPLLLVILKGDKTITISSIKRYLLIIGFMSIAGLILSLPTLKEIFAFISSEDNVRVNSEGFVYSYLTTDFKHLLYLLISGYEEKISSIGKFHELSFPLGLFLFFPFFTKVPKMVRTALLITLFVLVAFSMNFIPGNLISLIPPFSLFRVPQRSLIFLAFLVPPYILSLYLHSIRIKEITIAVTLSIPLIFLRQLEYLYLPLSILGFFIGKYKKIEVLRNVALTMGGLLLFSSTQEKVSLILRDSNALEKTVKELQDLKEKYPGFNFKKIPMSFQTYNRPLYDSTWKFLGGITYEGYGIPPQKLLKKASSLTGATLYPHTNILFLPNQDEILRQFGYQFKIIKNDWNSLTIEKL